MKKKQLFSLTIEKRNVYFLLFWKKNHLLASALKPVAHGSAIVHEPGPVHEPPQVIGYVSNGKRLELGKLNRSDTAQELKDKILEHMVKHC